MRTSWIAVSICLIIFGSMTSFGGKPAGKNTSVSGVQSGVLNLQTSSGFGTATSLSNWTVKPESHNSLESAMQVIAAKQARVVSSNNNVEALLARIDEAIRAVDGEKYYKLTNELNGKLLGYLGSEDAEVQAIGAYGLLEALNEGAILEEDAQQTYSGCAEILRQRKECTGIECGLINICVMALTYSGQNYNTGAVAGGRINNIGREMQAGPVKRDRREEDLELLKDIAKGDWGSDEANAAISPNILKAVAQLGGKEDLQEAAQRLVKENSGWYNNRGAYEQANPLQERAVIDALFELGTKDAADILKKFAFDKIGTKYTEILASIKLGYMPLSAEEEALNRVHLKGYFCVFEGNSSAYINHRIQDYGAGVKESLEMQQQIALAYNGGMSGSSGVIYMKGSGPSECEVYYPLGYNANIRNMRWAENIGNTVDVTMFVVTLPSSAASLAKMAKNGANLIRRIRKMHDLGNKTNTSYKALFNAKRARNAVAPINNNVAAKGNALPNSGKPTRTGRPYGNGKPDYDMDDIKELNALSERWEKHIAQEAATEAARNSAPLRFQGEIIDKGKGSIPPAKKNVGGGVQPHKNQIAVEQGGPTKAQKKAMRKEEPVAKKQAESQTEQQLAEEQARREMEAEKRYQELKKSEKIQRQRDREIERQRVEKERQRMETRRNYSQTLPSLEESYGSSILYIDGTAYTLY